MNAVAMITRLSDLGTLAHPLRVRALERLREPASAAAVARALGQTRQRMNFHIKHLEQAGLVRKVGERRSGGFVEDLYQAAARSFLVAPQVLWGDGARARSIQDQLPLRSLVWMGNRLQRDAAVLLERAAGSGERIASATIETEIRFASEDDRARFMQEYLRAVGPLLQKYGSREGTEYRLAVAVYPDPRAQEKER